MSLMFADTHNMVAYLNKSDASEGFNQVIDFLNASYIKYALTINPHIYVSCIKQFWNTIVVKQSNDVTRLQALVDKKKVVITEATIRDALRLDDAEGVDCLPNEEIFIELARMGYEKPSTKLTFCRKFNFFKYIFESLVRNIDSSSKFYMYPSIRRVGKGFSGAETPLFEGMLVGVIEEQDNAEEQVQVVAAYTAAQGADTAVSGDDVQDQYIPSPTPPPSPQPQPQSPPQAQPHAVDFPMMAQALEITKLKMRVKKLERGNKVKVLNLQRLQKVGTSQRIDTSDDTVIDDASNQGRRIDDLDRDVGVALMDDEEEKKKAKEAKVAGDDQVQGRQAEIYKIDMDHPSNCWVLIIINPLYLTTVSFGVDAAMDLEEKH
nr:xylulose kinase-1 [Tanacetum cinerariifolium]